MAKKKQPLPGKTQCTSIKSRRHPHQRCEATATKGDFCSRHAKSKVVWASDTPPRPPFTRKQRVAGLKIFHFWMARGRHHLRRQLGPAVFTPEIAENKHDVYTFEPLETIPLVYRFSYADVKGHIWLFDLRFLIQLLQHGGDMKNPFTQDLISKEVVQRLQERSEKLRGQKVPIVYTQEEELTPEQIWNQKVLDVFLKLTALGFGVNIIWFESLTLRGHQIFYLRLWTLWNQIHSSLTHAERERLVPGYNAGRTPLFKWDPYMVQDQGFDLKWWRKQNLTLMNAFLNRGQDRDTQGSGAIFLLTALAQTHPRAAEAFPWLAGID
jgi:hypothetical protein